tara:strand:- start:550 stop:762 length:213 start_codon:yes stop_codon:yes gene_type:complete
VAGAEKAGGLLALEHPLADHPDLFFVVYAGLPHGLIAFAALALMTGIPAKVVSRTPWPFQCHHHLNLGHL